MTTYKSKKYRGAKSEIQASTGVADICDVTISSLSTNEVLCYNGTNWVNGTVSGGGGGDVVDDTTPQLGGNLDLNGNTINGTGNLDISNGTVKLAGNYPTGMGNVALGCLAGNSIGGSAASNTFIGNRAGTNSDHPAINNVAVGHFALSCNTAGPDNTALGSQAIQSVTGTCNVGLGRCAGHAITSGNNNIVIGAYSAASSATVSNEITLGNSSITSLRIPGLQSGAADGQVLTYCQSNGNIVFKDAGGGGSISCFSYNSESSVLVASADLTSTCSALFGDVLISGNTITPDDSNTVKCLGSDGTLNISGNLSVQGDFLKLPLTDSCSSCCASSCCASSCCAPTGGCETTSIGAMRYNTSTNTVQVHNGSGFTGIGASSLNDLSDALVDDYTFTEWGTTYYRSTIAIGDNALASYSRSGINDEYGGIQGTNIAVGINTLQCMTPSTNGSCDAKCNIAIGTNVACSLTRGDSNILLGHNVFCCSYSDTCICDNVVMGLSSALNLGTSCMHFYRNTFVGNNVGMYTCEGPNTAGTHCIFDNTFIGWRAGYLNKNNGAVAIGACAGCRTTQISSSFNNRQESHVHIGYGAGSCSCGKGVITLGAYAGYRLNNGIHHLSMFIGNKSGNCNTGNLLCNIIIGGESGSYMCNSCYNTIVGTKILDQNFNLNVGSGCFTGCNNTIIGYDAAPSSKTVSNQITLGNSSITSLRANVTSISSLSDQRDKTNICDLSVGLCFVDELRPVTFDWNRRDESMSNQKDVGFIAQDLDSLQQKYNIEDHLNIVLKENPDRLEASPGKLIPILVKAIQELTKKVEELENKIGK
jgi:hypothetical protein